MVREIHFPEPLQPVKKPKPIVLFREKLFAQGVHASVQPQQKD